MLTSLIIDRLFDIENLEDIIILIGSALLLFITLPLDVMLFPIEFIIAIIIKIKRNK